MSSIALPAAGGPACPKHLQVFWKAIRLRTPCLFFFDFIDLVPFFFFPGLLRRVPVNTDLARFPPFHCNCSFSVAPVTDMVTLAGLLFLFSAAFLPTRMPGVGVLAAPADCFTPAGPNKTYLSPHAKVPWSFHVCGHYRTLPNLSQILSFFILLPRFFGDQFVRVFFQTKADVSPHGPPMTFPPLISCIFSYRCFFFFLGRGVLPRFLLCASFPAFRFF